MKESNIILNKEKWNEILNINELVKLEERLATALFIYVNKYDSLSHNEVLEEKLLINKLQTKERNILYLKMLLHELEEFLKRRRKIKKPIPL